MTLPAPGDVVALGGHDFTADEIVAFARQWDPQPFHLDAERAKDSLFGALCASGWHTACVWARLNALWLESLAGDVASGDAIRDLVWKLPVYAGDRLEFRNTVLDVEADAAGASALTIRAEGHKADGSLAFALTTTVRYRP